MHNSRTIAMPFLILAFFTTIAIPAAVEEASAAGDRVSATGKLNAIMTSERKVNITHGPIPALGWPGMTMDFRLADTASLEGIEVGAKVAFQLRKGSDGASPAALTPRSEAGGGEAPPELEAKDTGRPCPSAPRISIPSAA
jgi:Cu/Ag efflux protein CusF